MLDDDRGTVGRHRRPAGPAPGALTTFWLLPSAQELTWRRGFGAGAWPARRYDPRRLFFLLLGCVAIVLAVAGIVLPLVPTTPFLLLAAFCFARSSPRLHDWLVTHPRLGPPIAHWREGGCIAPRTKAAAVATMLALLVISWIVGVGATVLAIQAAVLALVALFIVTRPHPGTG